MNFNKMSNNDAREVMVIIEENKALKRQIEAKEKNEELKFDYFCNQCRLLAFHHESRRKESNATDRRKL